MYVSLLDTTAPFLSSANVSRIEMKAPKQMRCTLIVVDVYSIEKDSFLNAMPFNYSIFQLRYEHGRLFDITWWKRAQCIYVEQTRSNTNTHTHTRQNRKLRDNYTYFISLISAVQVRPPNHMMHKSVVNSYVHRHTHTHMQSRMQQAAGFWPLRQWTQENGRCVRLFIASQQELL